MEAVPGLADGRPGEGHRSTQHAHLRSLLPPARGVQAVVPGADLVLDGWAPDLLVHGVLEARGALEDHGAPERHGTPGLEQRLIAAVQWPPPLLPRMS